MARSGIGPDATLGSGSTSMITYRHAAALAVLLLVLTACGKSTNDDDEGGGPLGPSGSGTCRNLASQFTAAATTTGSSFSSTTTSTCTFSESTRQVQCTHVYSDNFGTSSTTTGSAVYLSAADLVDEVAVIPPRTYATSGVATQTGTAGTNASGVAYTFDGNRRVVRAVNTSPAGVSTTTYTAWDASGRPTVGTDVGPGFNNTLAISYDAGSRTRTTSINGGAVTTTETFDANGNLIRQVSSGGGSTTTSNITVGATQRICK